MPCAAGCAMHLAGRPERTDRVTTVAVSRAEWLGLVHPLVFYGGFCPAACHALSRERTARYFLACPRKYPKKGTRIPPGNLAPDALGRRR